MAKLKLSTLHADVHEPGMPDVVEMRDQPPRLDTYPLLEGLLRAKGLSLKGTYSYRDAADIFDCSVRALQERIKNGELRKRNLPGRAKFLAKALLSKLGFERRG
jgi:hypothetical protein